MVSRRRKLLVSRKELSRLWQAIGREGMTLVPLVMYFNHRGIVKLKIGVAKETAGGERRVALTPETCGKLVKAGAEVTFERGIGRGAHFTDDAYAAAGADVLYGGDGADAVADARARAPTARGPRAGGIRGLAGRVAERVPEAVAVSARCGGRDGSRHTAYRAARKVTTSIE